MAENHLHHFDTQNAQVLYTSYYLLLWYFTFVFIFDFFSAGIKGASPIYVNGFSQMEGTEW